MDLLDELSTSNSLTVSWEPGDNGGREQWFLVAYRINRDGEEFGPEEEIRDSFNATIEGLESNTEYAITVTSVNEIGKSDDTIVVYGTTYRKYSTIRNR